MGGDEVSRLLGAVRGMEKVLRATVGQFCFGWRAQRARG